MEMSNSLGILSAGKYTHLEDSGRDSENNIIVYFSGGTVIRPSDGINCWLYYARLGQ